MTEQERFNANFDNRLVSLETKFDLFMQEIKQQREDMRRQQDRQDALRAEHDAAMKAMQEKQDAAMKAMQEQHDAAVKTMQDKQDALSNQMHDLWRQTMLGVGGMMIALGALLFAALK